MQDALSQEVDGPAVHLPLQQFRPVDLPFALAFALVGLEHLIDRLPITLQSCGKTLQFREVTLVDRIQPSLQSQVVLLPHQPAKLLGQPLCRRDLRTLPHQFVAIRVILSVQVGRAPDQEPACLPR